MKNDQRVDRTGRTIKWDYDHLGRNTDEKWYSGQTLVRTISFTYDAAGELTQATDPAGTYGYEYDGAGRLNYQSQSFDAFSQLIEYSR